MSYEQMTKTLFIHPARNNQLYNLIHVSPYWQDAILTNKLVPNSLFNHPKQ